MRMKQQHRQPIWNRQHSPMQHSKFLPEKFRLFHMLSNNNQKKKTRRHEKKTINVLGKATNKEKLAIGCVFDVGIEIGILARTHKYSFWLEAIKKTFSHCVIRIRYAASLHTDVWP